MRKARVKIVEDEGLVALDLGNRLSKLGYSVAAQTGDGREALTMAREEKPDLVLKSLKLTRSQ